MAVDAGTEAETDRSIQSEGWRIRGSRRVLERRHHYVLLVSSLCETGCVLTVKYHRSLAIQI